jgi:Mg-chelatase subunit ChlI
MNKEKRTSFSDDEKIIARISELREALGMWPNSTLEQMTQKAREMSESIRDHARELESVRSEANAKVASAQMELESVKKSVRPLIQVTRARRELLGT